MAAPSVKKIGGISNSSVLGNIHNNENKNIQSSSVASKRMPSVRVLGAGKSYDKITSTQKKVSSVDSVQTSDTERMSGLRGNLIKGLSSKLSANTPSGASQPTNSGVPTSDLEMRIENLEKEISKKQDTLIFGDGIDINENTVSVSQDVANLSEEINEINQKIDELTEQIDDVALPETYPTKSYIEEHYYEKADLDEKLNQLSNPNIVSDFDPSFLNQSGE